VNHGRVLREEAPHSRALDPIVPVVAVSGVATPEIAAELVRAGADTTSTKWS
jgi:hypothetical protein